MAKTKAIALPLATLAIFLWHTLSQARIVDSLVAIVNNQVITMSDLRNRYISLQAEGGIKKEFREVSRSILEQLIEEKLLLQEANHRNIKVTDEELNRALDSVRKRFSSEEEFFKALKEANLSLEKLKENYRKRIMVQKLLRFEIGDKIYVSLEEMENYYSSHLEDFTEPAQIKLRQILIRINPQGDLKETKEKVNFIWQKLQEGEDFALLAKKYSQGPAASEGGDVGLIVPSKLQPELSSLVEKLQVGEMGKVQTKEGFHIVRVEMKKLPRVKSFSEVKEQIRGIIYQRKFDQEFTQWMDELKKKAEITLVEKRLE